MAQPLSVPLQQGGPPAGGDMVFGGPPGGAGLRGGPAGLPFLPPAVMLAVMLAVLVLAAVAFWFVFKKAGYQGALGLLMAVPLVNVGMLLFLAFSEWPIARELREQRALVAMHEAEARMSVESSAAAACDVSSTAEPVAS